MNFDEGSIRVHVGFIILVTILGLITSSSAVFMYMATAVLLLIYLNKSMVKKKQQELQLHEDRKYWIINLLKWIIPSFRNDPSITVFLTKITEVKDIDSSIKAELGLEMEKQNTIGTAPDIEKAETELIKMEERASILLGITVFIPVFFALIHLFRSVELPVFLLELQIGFILGQIVVTSQMNFYDISGWEEIYSHTREQLGYAAKDGRKFLNRFDLLYDDPQSQELGFSPKLSRGKPSSEFFALLINILIQLPSNYRQLVLEKVLDEISDLPQRERILITRWDAYKSRVNLIGIAGICVSALMAGISQFSIPQLNNELYQFTTTAYLSWGMYILAIGLNWLVIQNWYSRDKQFKIVLIYSVFYFFFYLLNVVLFT